jgi:hypothetical protein
MRGLLYGLIVLACAGSAAEAARPDPASDCGSLMTLENRGRACRMSDQPRRATVRARRVIDPATLLKHGLIW